MIWRGVIREYGDFLPVKKEESIVTLLEGNTPLIPFPAVLSPVSRSHADEARSSIFPPRWLESQPL